MELGGDAGFESFITSAVVSLVSSGEGVRIRLLWDTGAKNSFIFWSVLHFSSVTETGYYIVMRGMEMGLVPVHGITWCLTVSYFRALFSVEVEVRHALPVDGVGVILGNDLAGGAVWADVPPLVTARPLSAGARDDSG